MVVEGTITDVKANGPPELLVETKEGTYRVLLTPDTEITRAGKPVDPGVLKPDLRVRVTGRLSSIHPTTVSAETVETSA